MPSFVIEWDLYGPITSSSLFLKVGSSNFDESARVVGWRLEDCLMYWMAIGAASFSRALRGVPMRFLEIGPAMMKRMAAMPNAVRGIAQDAVWGFSGVSVICACGLEFTGERCYGLGGL